MAINTNDVITKFLEIYPKVENAISGAGAASALYKQGFADLEKFYDDCDITGNDKARLMAGYVTNSTAALISGAMQVSLGVLQQAYTLPMQEQTMNSEIEYKEAQTGVLKNSEAYNALIKVFQSLSDMMGSMGSGGIVATPAMIAASRMAVFKMLEILKNPNTSGTMFTASDMSYLESLVDKSPDAVAKAKQPDDMRVTSDLSGDMKNNINYR